MTENYIKLDLKSFQDMARTIEEQKEQIEFLQNECKEYHEIVKHQEETIRAQNKTISNITRVKLGLKLNNKELTDERNALIDELTTIKRMSMFEFSNAYSTVEQQEADGRAFARALLGGD